MDFSGSRVLVTGGSRGIGRAICHAFADAGAQVAVHHSGSDEATAEATRSSLHGTGHVSVAADMADAEAVRAAVDGAAADLGGLDVLVNNAAVYEAHPVTDTGYDEWQAAWRRTIGINLLGAANATWCAVRHMGGGGRIVNVSSRGAFRGEPLVPAYGASKAGLNAMGQSLAQALAPRGIFVGTVAPGFVETDMAADLLAGPDGDSIRAQSPLGRVARPDEVARVVLFLASPGTEFTTGTIVDVNGASYLRS